MALPPFQAVRILRIGAVAARTGMSQWTIRGLVRAGTFPAPIRLTPRILGWELEQVDAWITARAAESGASRG